MSQIIYVIHKTSSPSLLSNSVERLKLISKRINPENIVAKDTRIVCSENSIVAIYNPMSTITIKETSISMGIAMDDWSKIGEKPENIDGSFAIYRNNEDEFQICTDMVASRTIWFYKDREKFIASSSQRAIIMFLGDFEFNDKVIPWMLSSGTIGPGYSYDKRLNQLKPNSLVTLNKVKWTIQEENFRISLKNKYNTKQEAKEVLKETLIETFSKFKIDSDKYFLPLSGGYDSRGILMLLRKNKNLETVTWGEKNARLEIDGDAYIAMILAEKFGISNWFYESHQSNINVKSALKVFLANSEGRIDEISGYMDGMKMWSEFYYSGKECMIRGDELIGLSIPRTELEARRAGGITLLEDYYKMDYKEFFNYPEQTFELPDEKDLYRKKGYFALNFEHPYKFAALNSVKDPYLEIINPLLTSSVLKVVFDMFDDKIIGDKNLFKEIVDELCPDVPIAKKGANRPLEALISSENVVDEFIDCFDNLTSDDIIDSEIIELIKSKIHKTNKKELIIKSKTQLLRRILPNVLYNYVRSRINKREIDWHRFALRAYILINIGRIFKEDASYLKYDSNPL